MCMVSMVLSDFSRSHIDWPDISKIMPINPKISPLPAVPPSREEFDKLKADLEALKKLIPAVQEFDKDTGQEDCEHADKIERILWLAELAGVDFEDVLKRRDQKKG